MTFEAVLTIANKAGPHPPTTLKIGFDTASHRMRIEPQGQAGYMILDPDHARTFVVMTSRHTYAEQPYRPLAHAMFILADGFQYTSVGTASVAGQSCEAWDMQSATIAGTVCVTKDGVVLRVDATDSDGDGDDFALRLIARSVRYTSLPKAEFSPPADYSKLPSANPPPTP